MQFFLYNYVNIMTLLVSPKNVIDVVQSEGNLNQIGSLRRKMTIIDDGHVGIWHGMSCRDVTRQAQWNFSLTQHLACTTVQHVMGFHILVST